MWHSDLRRALLGRAQGALHWEEDQGGQEVVSGAGEAAARHPWPHYKLVLMKFILAWQYTWLLTTLFHWMMTFQWDKYFCSSKLLWPRLFHTKILIVFLLPLWHQLSSMWQGGVGGVWLSICRMRDNRLIEGVWCYLSHEERELIKRQFKFLKTDGSL